VGRQGVLPRAAPEALDLLGDPEQRALFGPAEHRHDEALFGRGRDAEHDVAVEHELAASVVVAGVELGVLTERGHRGLHHEGQEVELHAAPLGEGRESLAEGDERGEIAFLDEAELHRAVAALFHARGDRPPPYGEGAALEDGQLSASIDRGALEIGARDAPLRARALDLREIDAELARALSRGRRGEHASPLGVSVAALRATRAVDRGAGDVVAQDADGARHRPLVARRRGARRRGRRLVGGRVLDLEQDEHLAHLRDAALGHADLDDACVGGRGDRDRRLVGHHLDEGVVLGDPRAGRHVPLHDLAFVYALADVGHLEREPPHQSSMALRSAGAILRASGR